MKRFLTSIKKLSIVINMYLPFLLFAPRSSSADKFVNINIIRLTNDQKHRIYLYRPIIKISLFPFHPPFSLFNISVLSIVFCPVKKTERYRRRLRAASPRVVRSDPLSFSLSFALSPAIRDFSFIQSQLQRQRRTTSARPLYACNKRRRLLNDPPIRDFRILLRPAAATGYTRDLNSDRYARARGMQRAMKEEKKNNGRKRGRRERARHGRS